MSTNNTTTDLLGNDPADKPKLTQGLNVLTILTIIGCVLQLVTSIWSFSKAQANFDKKDQIIEQMNAGTMPSWVRSLMGDPDKMIAIMTKSYENRLPILLMSLATIVLCFVGALQMRKLKKQGFMLYIIGELLPFLTTVLFIGTFALSGFGFYIGCGFALLFILLYSLQRKNLVY